MAGEDGEDGEDGDAGGASFDEQLRRKPFDECSEEDLAAMERLLRRVPLLQMPSRRSRRLAPVPHGGSPDVRRSLRRAVATDGDLFRLAWRNRAIERPRLVLLCDTSGSMDPHSRFLLTFILALRRTVKQVEVFAFNTSLTRLTPWLGRNDIKACLDRLAAGVPGWSGGTRIGECLATFVAEHLDGLVDRKTDIVIMSDGLDCGPPAVLVEAMDALRRRARGVTWLNPLMGDVRYRPEAQGMAAALPFLHRFAPAHNLESLERAFARTAS